MRYEFETERDLQWAKMRVSREYEAILSAAHAIRNLRKAILQIEETAKEAGDGVMADRLLSHAQSLRHEHEAMVSDHRDFMQNLGDLEKSIQEHERRANDDGKMGVHPGSEEGAGTADDTGRAVAEMAGHEEGADAAGDVL